MRDWLLQGAECSCLIAEHSAPCLSPAVVFCTGLSLQRCVKWTAQKFLTVAVCTLF